MPFLSQACVAHGEIAKTGVCCESLVPWAYDANSGQAYDGFGCWNAPCAQAGQWAGPGGIGNRCCEGLTNVDGKCGMAVPGGTVPPPTPSPGGDFCKGTIVCSVPDIYLYGAAGVLVLLMAMGKKR